MAKSTTLLELKLVLRMYMAHPTLRLQIIVGMRLNEIGVASDSPTSELNLAEERSMNESSKSAFLDLDYISRYVQEQNPCAHNNDLKLGEDSKSNQGIQVKGCSQVSASLQAERLRTAKHNTVPFQPCPKLTYKPFCPWFLKALHIPTVAHSVVLKAEGALSVDIDLLYPTSDDVPFIEI
ncbi:uncharacterized protein BDR25DRAFT_361167 [Lindgomyces ingoldianus]|uniref:Uncharacterized protein n=1 Tax=Lindgomyces ingoldianus TaxID=673940 RepID=A0ACB6QEM0_9PLEO|nr:uncharacterized protein BDR25DRAFT_361167 [Lindgomyces ingoldianus]KAF2464950.1 hypothetical protein BDR25DRAFT_361167 [Lindgomyces ingoldianus]